MTVVFVSNYFNHHQKPFSEEMYRRLGDKYHFIATSVMREERRNLGYSDENTPDYVVKSYLSEFSKNRAIELINSADVVICGSCPEEMIAKRIASGKLVFRYSERPFKTEPSFLKRVYHKFKLHPYDTKKNVYLLSVGEYAAADYNKVGLYHNKAYKWGYFPETKQHEPNELFESKQKGSILWCGRFIDWKHPDSAIRIAKRLKEEGYSFNLNFVGGGEMETELKQTIAELQLEDNVRFHGSMSPEKVRKFMEAAEIFLFTSDRKEGWGAVLNEAMNSGCAVVASNAAGATSFLVKDGENGYIYHSGDEDDLYKKVKQLLDSPDISKKFGVNAYKTISELWNAKIAAERFLCLLKDIVNGDTSLNSYSNGVCSKLN